MIYEDEDSDKKSNERKKKKKKKKIKKKNKCILTFLPVASSFQCLLKESCYERKSPIFEGIDPGLAFAELIN